MGILFVLFMILLVLYLIWLLFVSFVLPVWTLVHCGTSSLTSRQKTVWIVAIVLTGPVASLLYGFFVSNKRFFKINAVVSGALLLLTAAGMVWGVTTLSDLTQKSAADLAAAAQASKHDELAPADAARLHTALTTLGREAENPWNVTRLRKASVLLRFFLKDVEDKEITAKEFQEWIARYDAREATDADVLDKQAQELRKKKASR